jgi:hypothetical protein
VSSVPGPPRTACETVGAPKISSALLARPAVRARENGADGDAKLLDRGADRTRLGATGIGEIALLRAIRVVGHRLVVLTEVGRRVPQVQHVAALAQGLDQRLAFERLRRLRPRR